MVLLLVIILARAVEATTAAVVEAAANSRDSVAGHHRASLKVRMAKVNATLGPNPRALLRHPRPGCRAKGAHVVWAGDVIIESHDFCYNLLAQPTGI